MEKMKFRNWRLHIYNFKGHGFKAWKFGVKIKDFEIAVRFLWWRFYWTELPF